MRLIDLAAGSVGCHLRERSLLAARSTRPSFPNENNDDPGTAAALDPAAATRAWLETVPAEKRARSDASFEGAATG